MKQKRQLNRGLALLFAIVGVLSALGIVSSANATWSAARIWDEQMLQAIRINTPRPPVHARNLYHTSIAMWDAWAAYDPVAQGVIHNEAATAREIEAARAEAVSFAAYRVLKQRFSSGPGSPATQIALDAQMDALGYDKTFTSTVGPSPAAVGNRVAADVLAYGMGDGSNQANNYAPNNGYAPLNDPLIIALPGTTMNDKNHWQPLAFDYYVKQNGIIVGTAVQSFVCPHWEGVKPFAMSSVDHDGTAYFDPPPPPVLGGLGDADFKAYEAEVIQKSGVLDPTDSPIIDIGPGAFGNNTVGENDGTGYPVNPYTGQPYAPNPVKLGDFARVISEFFADGPNSETPPGHWNVLANYVSDSPLVVKKVGGVGPICNDLEWDVKLYLAINGAVHDAAVGCWGVKGIYDTVRPISSIRYMGGLGQSTDTGDPSYNPDGLPLIPGSIEIITDKTTAPGQRHEALAGHEGEIAIFAWKGQPADPLTQIGGAGWILAVNWMTYQKKTFVTPPFAAYTSGHSTYSRSGAEVLSAFTGDTYFPGGLGSFTANPGYLSFEYGPSAPVTLQWARYYDAADQAGISRLYGGIHTRPDDKQGRIMGSYIGPKAYAKALEYFGGHACPADIAGGNHAVNVDDLLAVINSWGACQPAHACFGDIVVNGVVNVDDLLAVINSWGNCP